MKTRFTVWETGYYVAENLGIEPDYDSKPELFEWYYTMEANDGKAFAQLLVERRALFRCCSNL